MYIGYRRQDERGRGSLRVVVSTKAAVDRAAKSWPVSLSCAQTCPSMNGPYFVQTWKTFALLCLAGIKGIEIPRFSGVISCLRYRPCHDKRGIPVVL